MTIRTIEALEGLEPGTKVWVGQRLGDRREYERGDGGLRAANDTYQTVLGTHLFTGLAAAGQVTVVDDAPIQVRDVFRSTAYAGLERILVVGRVADGTAYCAYFRNGTYYSMQEHPFDTLRSTTWERVREPEPWMTTAIPLVRVICRLQRQVDNATAMRTENARLLREARDTIAQFQPDQYHVTDGAGVRITGDFTVERIHR